MLIVSLLTGALCRRSTWGHLPAPTRKSWAAHLLRSGWPQVAVGLKGFFSFVLLCFCLESTSHTEPTLPWTLNLHSQCGDHRSVPPCLDGTLFRVLLTRLKPSFHGDASSATPKIVLLSSPQSPLCPRGPRSSGESGHHHTRCYQHLMHPKALLGNGGAHF